MDMTDPAQLLISYFNASAAEAAKFSFRALYRATNDIEDHCALVAQARGKAPAYVKVLPTVQNALVTYHFHDFEGGNGWAPERIGEVSESDLGLLEWASDDFQSLANEVSDEQKEQIVKLVDAVRAAIRDDSTLDDALRVHLLKAVQHISSCLDNYEVTGTFELNTAITELLGLMRIAEETSNAKDAWASAWQTWGKPIAIGIVSSMPAASWSAVLAANVQAIG